MARPPVLLGSPYPVCYIAMLLLAHTAHMALCYPAATCRGYPPLHWFWEHVAIYLGFLGVALAPIRDDLSRRSDWRFLLLGGFCMTACLTFGTAIANIRDARPHIGHLAGVTGVVLHCWPFIIVNAVTSLIIVVPFVFCLESVASGWWRFVGRVVQKSPKTHSDDTN
jgi:hypothetical protein